MSQTPQRRKDALPSVRELLNKVPLVDGHNDLALVIRNDPAAAGNVRKYRLDQLHNEGDTDIPRLRQGQVGGVVFAAFIPGDTPHPATRTLEQIDLILQIPLAHPSVFEPVLAADDILQAKQAGKIAAIVAVEGGVGLENSLSPLRIWYAAGVRLMTLCHNETLDWVDSATDQPRHGGLTSFGQRLVRELNRLGIIVDCSHVSVDTMRQVLEISSAPIVFSHSNARSLCDHPRNVPDDVLARLKDNDGMIMATFIPDFVSEEVRKWMIPVRKKFGSGFGKSRMEVIAAHEAEHGKRPSATIEQVADHIQYLADRVGATRVGIGSDFYGVANTTVGLSDVSCFPELLAELKSRGWSDDNLAKLAGLNFIRVFKAVEREKVRLQDTAFPEIAVRPYPQHR